MPQLCDEYRGLAGLLVKEGEFVVDLEDEVLDGCAVVHEVEQAAQQALQEVREHGRHALLTIFILSVFVGFEVVSKVSTVLHTPLMSGANAIHGVVVMGAIIVAGNLNGFARAVDLSRGGSSGAINLVVVSW